MCQSVMKYINLNKNLSRLIPLCFKNLREAIKTHFPYGSEFLFVDINKAIRSPKKYFFTGLITGVLFLCHLFTSFNMCRNLLSYLMRNDKGCCRNSKNIPQLRAWVPQEYGLIK